jgi:Cohesin domain
MATTVSIEPTSNAFSVGDTFSLNIIVSDVVDLYGFQFDIGFSPSVVSATGITEGAFLSSGGSTFFIPGDIDNVLGTISLTGDTLLSLSPGVDGGGILATVTFQALTAGSSPVDLSNIILLDSGLSEISTSPQNGMVNVNGNNTVPSPGSLFLFMTGLAGLFLSKRARIEARLMMRG